METAYSDAYPVWGAICVKIMFVFFLLQTKKHSSSWERGVARKVWLVTVMKVVSPEPGDCTGLGLSTWVVKSIATKNH